MNEDDLETKRKPFTIRYIEPASLEEALQRKDELGAAILQIQSQLGSRQEDNEWRRKTKVALLCKTEELRRIKSYVREHKQSKFDALSEAVEILQQLEKTGVDITDRGRLLIKQYLTS